jgi:pimeloyl-ACP methyl ester carboxylesterase
MKGVATEVNGAVLQGCEHFVMEECPNEVIRQLKPFLQSR